MNPQRWILVPLDGSKGAENALDIAASLARVYEASLDIVHVLDPSQSSAETGVAEAAFKDYGEQLVLRHALPQGTRVRMLTGPAANTLIEASASAEMVVMATHGRGGFRAMFIGSVADKVVRSCECPVVLVPAIGAPAVPPHVILVPLDGSELSEQALPTARLLATTFGAKVLLLRAFNPVIAADVEFGYYNLPLSLAEDLQAYLNEVASPGEQTEVFEGDPATAILAASEDRHADMIVMTSSGKGLAGRLILGSTTDRVIRSVHKPIMIIRAG